VHVLGVIPARLGSTRLPNKPLQPLAGQPLVVRVWERARASGRFAELVVATEAPEVAAAVERAGGKAVLTSPDHETGTERVAEVAARPEYAGMDLVANVQGDEPFLDDAAIAGAIDRAAAGDDVGTCAGPLDAGLAGDPARVKVVTDAAGRALWFSRAPIPFRRDPEAPTNGLYWQHVGLYVYRPDALRRWVTLAPTAAERAEKLEQLRALHHGLVIGVARLETPVLPGVDTPDDLHRAEAHWHATREITR
jgi:3-deoxy-manno-octulosonate cytidylyltransferase (CMP-KDO synthetase)